MDFGNDGISHRFLDHQAPSLPVCRLWGLESKGRSTICGCAPVLSRWRCADSSKSTSNVCDDVRPWRYVTRPFELSEAELPVPLFHRRFVRSSGPTEGAECRPVIPAFLRRAWNRPQKPRRSRIVTSRVRIWIALRSTMVREKVARSHYDLRTGALPQIADNGGLNVNNVHHDILSRRTTTLNPAARVERIDTHHGLSDWLRRVLKQRE